MNLERAILLCSTALLPLQSTAAESSNHLYSIVSGTLDAAGGLSSSAVYSTASSFGAVGGAPASNAASITARSGFIGQLYEVTAINLSAAPGGLSEGGTNQLFGIAFLDDGTVTRLHGPGVAWKVVSGPVNSVNNDGLVITGFVYQDTPAQVQVAHQDKSATLGLLVLNTGRDNFGLYAGDGLPDDWQVQYFGQNNLNAASAADPDGDGQNNFFEYTAGLNPTNALSRFRLSIATPPGLPDRKEITFSPFIAGHSYIVQYRTNAASGGFTPLSDPGFDTGPARTVTDPNAANGVRIYRVQISAP